MYDVMIVGAGVVGLRNCKRIIKVSGECLCG